MSYRNLSENDRETVADLVRQHGLEPNDISVDFIIQREGGRTYLLLDEYQRDDFGRIVVMSGGPVVAKSHRIEVASEALPASLRPSTP